MKTKVLYAVALTTLAAGALLAARQSAPGISGDYLEVRSCDVFTGPCVANSEMGLSGREGMLVWSVRQGAWNGTALDGLSVIAVVKTDDTLGDQRYQPRSGKAVLVIDAKANAAQRAALTDLARSLSGKLVKEVVEVKSANIETQIATCTKRGCASVKAGELVEINTRCFSESDHLCGNEDTFYPPLTEVNGAYPVFTELATFNGSGLNETWELASRRSAFLAGFSK